ncbi:MAG: TonB family protein, partial [Burkholderiaceae bacterium]
PEQPLQLVKRVEPEFSRQLLNNLRAGSVNVRFTVQPDGSVAQVEALSATNKRLAGAAIAAVAQWRFAPVPRARDARVELGFRLD